jgi:hypothetical protein
LVPVPVRMRWLKGSTARSANQMAQAVLENCREDGIAKGSDGHADSDLARALGDPDLCRSGMQRYQNTFRNVRLMRESPVSGCCPSLSGATP